MNLRDQPTRDAKYNGEARNGGARAVELADLLKHLTKYMDRTEKALVELRLQDHTITSAAQQLGLDPNYARVILGRMKKRLAGMFDLPVDFP
jgi:hypothetical protein